MLILLVLFYWAVSAVAVAVTAAIIPGIELDGGVLSWFLVAAVLGLVNAIVGTALRVLTLPLIVLTVGLFSLVVNAVVILVADALMDTLEVDGFWPALFGSMVISAITALLLMLLPAPAPEPVPDGIA